MIFQHFIENIGKAGRRVPVSFYLSSAICISTITGIGAFADELQPFFVLNTGQPTAPLTRGWQPLSTPGPDGVIHSIMHTAEPLKSDPDFAGMIVRCSPKRGLQVGFVLIVPLPPRDKPNVTLSVSGGRSLQFSATVMPPGSIALITADAEPLTRALASSTGDVSVVIQGDQTFRGVVRLNEFGPALASLRTHCS